MTNDAHDLLHAARAGAAAGCWPTYAGRVIFRRRGKVVRYFAMPYELTWEPRGVLRRYHGAVTVRERQRSFELICSDTRFDALQYAITDYLDVSDYEITEDATVEIAALHVAPTLTNPNIVMAAVVTDARIVAAIEHFIALGFTKQPYRIFPTEAAARAWTEHMKATMPLQPRNSFR